MTAEEFVEAYNCTAEEHYFGHRITLHPDIEADPGKGVLQRVAGGAPITFMLTERYGQITNYSMFCSNPDDEGHHQINSIAASVLMHIATGLQKDKRKAVVQKLGIITGQYAIGKKAMVGRRHKGRVTMFDAHTLLFKITPR